MKVGFIGLGKMGRPMSQHLLKAGFDLTVHNRSRGVVDELAGLGAHPASSPEEVARQVDVVLTCLPTPESVEEVYLGTGGLMAAARRGQLLVDHSTVGLATSRKLAAAAGERGASFLDAPVSGGPEGAQSGALTIMVGGEQEAFERARPVFSAYGKNLHYVGPNGVGIIIKLVNQLLVGIHVAAAAEAMVLGTKAGADPQMMLDIIGTSFGASAMLNRNGPRFLQRNFNPATTVDLLLKDLGLIKALGEALGVPLAMGSQALQAAEDARRAGLGAQDFSALVLPVEQAAGVEVRRG